MTFDSSHHRRITVHSALHSSYQHADPRTVSTNELLRRAVDSVQQLGDVEVQRWIPGSWLATHTSLHFSLEQCRDFGLERAQTEHVLTANSSFSLYACLLANETPTSRCTRHHCELLDSSYNSSSCSPSRQRKREIDLAIRPTSSITRGTTGSTTCLRSSISGECSETEVRLKSQKEN